MIEILLAVLTGGVPPLVDPEKDVFLKELQGPVDGYEKKSFEELIRKNNQEGRVFNQKGLSPEHIPRWESLENNNEFGKLEDISRAYPYDKTLSQWLEKKAYGGSVPIMWIVANRQAENQNIEAAVNWGTAAVLGIHQERALCLDKEVDYAASDFIRRYPKIIQFERGNPYLLKEAKIFGIKVLENAKDYKTPELWLCKKYSGSARLNSLKTNRPQPLVYESIYFDILRARSRNALRKKFEIADKREEEPPMPEKPKK